MADSWSHERRQPDLPDHGDTAGTYQTTGTPQGGVISPLLANIYLHGLDLALTKWGYKVVRYADDMVVLCPSLNKAKTALGLLKQMAEGELRLTLHPEKTRLTTFGQANSMLSNERLEALGLVSLLTL